MNLFSQMVDYIIHVDVYLNTIMHIYGGWTYAVLFLVIFFETGLVVTPFLPGDSLLFAAGALVARFPDALSLMGIIVLLIAAAILGDGCNFAIGQSFGLQISARGWWFLPQEYFERTFRFYEKHGGKTIVLARFVPIVRTFAPFVAGMGKMHYSKFLLYNVVGGVAWVLLFTTVGYLFGNIPFIQNNFEYVAIAIVLFSLLPIAAEWWRSRTKLVAT
jgi:membrane-associated protein